jgi:hypothetical protein
VYCKKVLVSSLLYKTWKGVLSLWRESLRVHQVILNKINLLQSRLTGRESVRVCELQRAWREKTSSAHNSANHYPTFRSLLAKNWWDPHACVLLSSVVYWPYSLYNMSNIDLRVVESCDYSSFTKYALILSATSKRGPLACTQVRLLSSSIVGLGPIHKKLLPGYLLLPACVTKLCHQASLS